MVALMVSVAIRAWYTPVANVSEVSAQVETSAVTLPPPQAVAKADGYQLIVGANPRLNQEQVFLPPTNSVAITNGEEQLLQLIKQEQETRQQQQQTVQQ
ncbi:hypothetical protein A3D45_00230 [Candidatus Falkowbacteria bacterium RIFCSPHIGHO2_02_FULL_42_9]|uniref:Uncharacterized protein n=1 Tax=Candidatus Falkowbacteria bacterium RIFCSPHIGHO2_02_FULL_42_9 TaxID=1797986 RepID=A0A1F5S8H8_9BACT|nr:MAG: hypothetical protein A3D45_00230 [Candidatus Falkowbacteria bacterium RIFCSPHIGHO2_02_FULL_42_9]